MDKHHGDQREKLSDPLFPGSDDFLHYSHRRGDRQIPAEDIKKPESRIAHAHKDSIRVRFWNAPDFSNAWTQLINLQVDFINTDHIDALAQYLQTVPFRTYHSAKMK